MAHPSGHPSGMNSLLVVRPEAGPQWGAGCGFEVRESAVRRGALARRTHLLPLVVGWSGPPEHNTHCPAVPSSCRVSQQIMVRCGKLSFRLGRVSFPHTVARVSVRIIIHGPFQHRFDAVSRLLGPDSVMDKRGQPSRRRCVVSGRPSPMAALAADMPSVSLGFPWAQSRLIRFCNIGGKAGLGSPE